LLDGVRLEFVFEDAEAAELKRRLIHTTYEYTMSNKIR
jgi:hypothetical protein